MANMGSTSYIIPLRSESDEEYEPTEPQPQPEPVAFRNKVTPTSMMITQAEVIRSIQSRSPLFRAKSREYDRSTSETRSVSAATTATTTICSAEKYINNESGTAKMKRSIFSNKSNSAGASSTGSTVPSKPNRSYSAKSLKKGKT